MGKGLVARSADNLYRLVVPSKRPESHVKTVRSWYAGRTSHMRRLSMQRSLLLCLLTLSGCDETSSSVRPTPSPFLRPASTPRPILPGSTTADPILLRRPGSSALVLPPQLSPSVPPALPVFASRPGLPVLPGRSSYSLLQRTAQFFLNCPSEHQTVSEITHERKGVSGCGWCALFVGSEELGWRIEGQMQQCRPQLPLLGQRGSGL